MAVEKVFKKGGAARYKVSVRDCNGRWFPRKSFERMADAERHERSLLNQRDAGDAAQVFMARKTLFQDYWSQWAEDRRSETSEGWRISQNQMMRDHILPHLSEMKLETVEPRHIAKILRAMKDKGLGGQMRLHVYNVLHKMFGDAVEYYCYLQKSPVKKCDRPKVIPKQHFFLSVEESVRLMKYVENHFLGPAIWIGLLAGLRPSEIQALKVGAVDFAKREIHIREAYKRKIKTIEPFPKQKKLGIAIMPKALAVYLSERCRTLPMQAFAAPGNNRGMLDYGVFRSTLIRLCKEIGITVVTPHKLRHSCTVLWSSMGATEEDMIAQLNHSGSGSIRVYMKPSHERGHRIAAEMDLASLSQSVKPNLAVIAAS